MRVNLVPKEFLASVLCPLVPREVDYPSECIILPVHVMLSTDIFGFSTRLLSLLSLKNLLLVPVFDFLVSVRMSKPKVAKLLNSF